MAQTHPLAAAHRRELADLLAPLALPGPTIGHAWPQPLPATWSTQFHRRQPLPYTRVQPVIVAEICVDAAYDADHGRWRHPARYLRPRADLSAHDVPRWRPDVEREVLLPDPRDTQATDAAA